MSACAGTHKMARRICVCVCVSVHARVHTYCLYCVCALSYILSINLHVFIYVFVFMYVSIFMHVYSYPYMLILMIVSIADRILWISDAASATNRRRCRLQISWLPPCQRHRQLRRVPPATQSVSPRRMWRPPLRPQASANSSTEPTLATARGSLNPETPTSRFRESSMTTSVAYPPRRSMSTATPLARPFESS